MSASSARDVWYEESVGPGPRQLNHGGGHAIFHLEVSDYGGCNGRDELAPLTPSRQQRP